VINGRAPGLLGFYATLAGAVGGLVLGWSTDLVGGRMKVILVGLCVGSFLAYGWFAMLCIRNLGLMLTISPTLPGLTRLGHAFLGAHVHCMLTCAWQSNIMPYYALSPASGLNLLPGTSTATSKNRF